MLLIERKQEDWILTEIYGPIETLEQIISLGDHLRSNKLGDHQKTQREQRRRVKNVAFESLQKIRIHN